MKKSDKHRIEPDNSRQIELIILIVYLMHTAAFMFAVPKLGAGIKQTGTAVLLVLSAVVIAFLFFRKVKSYAFRAYFTTVLLWINVLVYALQTDDFPGFFTSIGAITMLLTLYGLPNIFAVGNLFYTALIVIHLLVIRDISISLDEQGMRIITRILSVYLIEGLAAYLVYTQQEHKRRLLSNIESLHRVEHSKDDFMANVSHEIRTPVNTICGMSEIVLQNELPREVRGYVHDIRTAGRNLLSVVSDILDFQELESGKISVLQDSYSITSVVNDIVSTANARNSEKQLKLIVDCDPSMPSVLIGDRQKICRAVINVIDNAIKFTREGGAAVSIGTRAEDYGVNLCITVHDTGIGISQENLEKIFTSFNQADMRSNREEGGIGLGLAISKAMVSRMGGFLNIESTYGEGTRVSITVPQKVEDKTPCIAVKDAKDKNILVYLHIERIEYPLLRKAGRSVIAHMAADFEVNAVSCRNLAEVKQHVRDEEVTHIFIGRPEYDEDPDFFNETAKKLQVTLIIEGNMGGELPEDDILCISSPLYSLSVAAILNGENVRDLHTYSRMNRFTAPEAHVLIVDDNLMNLKVVEGLLRPYRLKVTTATSGEEALKKLRTKEFDFVFMDHMMPDMDGVETFRRIRDNQSSYYQNLPVIALTANAVGDAREMFMAEGFADYIPKPIEISSLEHVLRKFIPRSKMVYTSENLRAAQSADAGALEKKDADRGTDLSRPDSGIKYLNDNGIDTAAGANYCGGTDDYLEIARMFYNDGEKNIFGIRKALDREDLKSFIILTHTVKSTSKSVGAAELSELSKGLEASGREAEKNGEGLAGIPDIFGSTERMLNEYARVLGIFESSSAVFPDGPSAGASAEKACEPADNAGGVSELSDEEFYECCKGLSERIDSFDNAAVTEFLNTLNGKTYRGKPLGELFLPVRVSAEDFDFVGAGEALNDIKGEPDHA